MKKHYIYNTILSLLLKCKTMAQLKQLHSLMVTSSVVKNTIPLSKLIDFCVDSATGDLSHARSVFDHIPRPSLYIWNSMIRGYSDSDTPINALIMYRKMLRFGSSPDHFTFPFALKACSIIGDPRFGESLHSHITKTGFEIGVYNSTSLLHMYSCCGNIESGLKVFDFIPKWNIVAWASLISGLVNNDRAREAIKAFEDMTNLGLELNEITAVNVLVACARTGDVATGKRVHDLVNGSKSNIILATAIVDMYAKCGILDTAREVFDEMPERNSFSWNSMIGAYNKHGRAEKSLELFSDMQFSGLLPDQATFVVVIGACANLGALSSGRTIHARVEKTRFSKDLTVSSGLVYMYSKSGDLVSARSVFHGMKNKDAEAWTIMILALATHGHGEEALATFDSMQKDGTVIPDRVTYIGVLCACGHAGLVEEGLRRFDEMRDIYGIVPKEEHYSCVVDLLSRAGKFDEAMRCIEEMPFEPSVVVWGAILNGCEIHENADLANKVRAWVTKLESRSSGVFVLLSNIYARSGNWQGVNLARDLMRQKMIVKNLGQSSVHTSQLE